MAKMKFANNANTTLASSLTAIATSMSVTSATKFPVLNPLAPVPEYFYCTLTDVATQTVIEIVKVTATSGTTWTISRGQDGTTGTAFSAGDVVSLRLVRASLDDFPKLDEANTFTGVLTASGGVVGNLTGNASTVTTNANLTGPITSVGNATSIASQTGTGTKFVVDTSPTLVTPTATTTIGVGAATPSASGAGITFPATQSASTDANTLDDYEEGTWTPVYDSNAGSAGTAAYTSSGKYTKIGNLVFVDGSVTLTNKGSWSDKFRISGLPFNPATNSAVNVRNFANSTTAITYISGYTNNGNTMYFVFNGAAATTMSALAISDVSATFFIAFSAIYQV